MDRHTLKMIRRAVAFVALHTPQGCATAQESSSADECLQPDALAEAVETLRGYIAAVDAPHSAESSIYVLTYKSGLKTYITPTTHDCARFLALSLQDLEDVEVIDQEH